MIGSASATAESNAGRRLASPEQRLHQAVDVVALGLDVDLEAGLAGGLAGHRADRDDAGAAGRSSPSASTRLRTVDEEVKVR